MTDTPDKNSMEQLHENENQQASAQEVPVSETPVEDPPVQETSVSEAPEEDVQPDREPHTINLANDRKRTLRKFWIKTAFMLALIIISVGVMFGITKYIPGGEKTVSFRELIRSMSTDFLLILIAVIVFYVIVETSKYAYMLKISTGKFRLRISFKTMFLGKYYDGITPMSTGGQPFQIYYLHKKNIPKGAATAIPLMRYLISALCVTIISIVLLIITPDHLKKGVVTTTMYALSWVSIALNCFFPSVIIFFTAFPNATKKVIAGIISLLAKMHIVKHQYETTKRWMYELNEYSKAIKEFAKKFYELIPVIILSALETLIAYAIPFFTVIALTGIEATEEFFVQILCLSMLTRYTALLVPTPGNTGAVEASGYLVFTTVAAMIPSKIGWVVLVWRFLTYYMYILSGIGINIFEIIRDAVRNKRALKQKEEE